MIVQLVYDNINNKLDIPKVMLPENGKPFAHHFLGTPIENLVELSGRVCYDSCKQEKTRSSQDYHKHIQEVKHYSVLEHANIIFEVKRTEQTLLALIERPGVHVYRYDNNAKLLVNINFRSLLDWETHNQWADLEETKIIYNFLIDHCKKIAPLIFGNIPHTYYPNSLELVICPPKYQEEVWASFYLGEVSRNCIYEMIRHSDYTAISQRSTRYVDEDESDWIWHPVYEEYLKENPNDSIVLDKQQLVSDARNIYRNECMKLESWLLGRNVNKFAARKLARGAARSVLGSCLATELIFSCTLWELEHILTNRSNDAADTEIRLLTNRMLEEVQSKLNLLTNYTKFPSTDRIGDICKVNQ